MTVSVHKWRYKPSTLLPAVADVVVYQVYIFYFVMIHALADEIHAHAVCLSNLIFPFFLYISSKQYIPV